MFILILLDPSSVYKSFQQNSKLKKMKLVSKFLIFLLIFIKKYGKYFPRSITIKCRGNSIKRHDDTKISFAISLLLCFSFLMPKSFPSKIKRFSSLLSFLYFFYLPPGIFPLLLSKTRTKKKVFSASCFSPTKIKRKITKKYGQKSTARKKREFP